MNPLCRRKLLILGGASGAAACAPTPGAVPDAGADDVAEVHLALDGGLAYATRDGASPDGPGVDVGAFADLPVGAWRYSPGARAVVARDALGVYAFSALCTHEGCLLSPPDARGVTRCPCHDSRFDGEGRVLEGPAARALRRLAVRVVNGRVRVDPSQSAPLSARAAPAPDGGLDDAGATPDSAVDPCARGVDLGPASQFAANTWTRLQPRGLIVARDTAGLYAYSARCPHQGCIVEAPAATGEVTCACHGSRFDGRGRVLSGPARDGLEHYAVQVCDGRVRVDAEVVVPPETRAVVP